MRDLDCAIDYYQRFLGLHLVERVEDDYAFLTRGDLHHEVALQNVGPNAPVPPSHGTGLYDVALEVPDRHSLAEIYYTMREAGIEVATVDHLISWAMYFSDQDGNGLEIYWDTRKEPGGQRLWRGLNLLLAPERITEGTTTV